MATRTVQLIGQGYGTTPASITATANGVQIYSGPVSTVDQPLPALPDLNYKPTNVLCTFETDTAFTGQIPMTCEVTAGTVIFADILANYATIPNPIYTQSQLDVLNDPDGPMSAKVPVWESVANPPLSQSDIDTLLNPASTGNQIVAILTAHNCQEIVSTGVNGFGPIDNTDPRSNVVINGVAQTPDRGNLPGTWYWTINTGSTLGYNLDVSPANV